MALPAPETALNSLGFAKPPAETRVVVAMSGGGGQLRRRRDAEARGL